jgi:beta-lactamase regulating signal transducer with metallopeptidase domain
MNLLHPLTATPLAFGLGLLALETTLVLAVGLLVSRRMASPLVRRTLWQTLFLVLALLAVLESCGVGAAWLSWRAKTPPRLSSSAVVPPASIQVATVSFPTAPPSPAPAGTTPVAPARITGAIGSWAFGIWLFGTFVLLTRASWARVAFAVFVSRRPAAAPALLDTLQILKTRLNLRRAVRLTELDGLTGPIAHGWWRAEISIPPAFTTRFTATQQSAMLAHELAHVAARDSRWLFLAEAVAALWWWHPFIWMARRRFQESTESAADELCLLVPNGPEALAECLVRLGGELSRLRIAGGLGVSGKGFRSSLGRRVAHLECLPRQGGRRLVLNPPTLILVRAAAPGIAVMVALATAMLSKAADTVTSPEIEFRRSLVGLLLGALGQAQNSPPPAQPRYAGATVNWPAVSPEPAVTNNAAKPYVYQIRSGDTLARIVDTLRQQGWVITQQELVRANPEVNWRRLLIGQKVQIPATNSTPNERWPVGAVAATPAAIPEEIPKPAPNQPAEVVRPGAVVGAVGAGVPAVASAVATPAPAAAPVAKAQAVPAPSATVGAVIAATPVAATSAAGTAAELQTRWFKLDAQALRTSLRDWQRKSPPQKASPAFLDLTRELERFLAVAGVELSAPGRQLAYNERSGTVMVRATLAELELVEQTVQVMNTAPTQVMLEVKLCEVPEEAVGSLGTRSPGGELLAPILQPPAPGTESIQGDAALKAILTEAQTRTVLRALETRRGVNILTAPKLTTLSGHQAQIKTVRIQSIVTDLDFSTNIVKDSTQPVVTIQPITQPFELGPIIDLFPYVQADQKTVSLTARAQIREFEGYENLSWMQAVVRQGGETRKQLAPLPKFRLREVSASAVVRDGHTLILAGGTIEEERVEPREARPARSPKAAAETRPSTSSNSKSRKMLLIMITPTLIDASGQRMQ